MARIEAGKRRLSADDVLRIAELASASRLIHGFSTRALGSMRGAGGVGAHVTPARRAFVQALGLEPERLTVAGAVHGARVARVDVPAPVVEGVDALITAQPDLPLLVTCADCYAIILHDPVRGAVGLAHAGWRGTAAAVATAAVRALEAEYGSNPRELIAGLGPGICGGCYEVSADVARRFAACFLRPARGSEGHFLLDLAAANRAQLEAAGLDPSRIHAHGACTKETPELPSHRRSPDGSRFACIAAIA